MNERTVDTPAGPARVWEKGAGDALGFFAGLGGLPAWLDALDKLAAKRKVVVPALPGYPGGADYEALDDVFDWTLAATDLHAAAGLDGGDLMGASVGGALAAEVASIRADTVRRLVLAAPLGMFDEADPIADMFAQKTDEVAALMSNNAEAYAAYMGPPDGADAHEWTIVQLRANMSAARLLWPLSDTGLKKRLGRVTQPTLLLWGEDDRVIPPSYAKRFAAAIAGPTEIAIIPKAGHAVLFDAPDAAAAAVQEFLDG